MLSLSNARTKILTLVTIIFLVSSADAELTQNSLQLLWERNFGDDNFKYTADAAAVSPKDGGVWIAGTVFPTEDSSGQAGQIWLWKINQEGERVQEIEPQHPFRDSPRVPRYKSVSGVATLGDGHLLLVVEFADDQSPSVIKITSDGKVKSVKEITQLNKHVTFSKMIPLSDDNFLLVGLQGREAVVMKIDAAGNILWNKTFSHIKKDASDLSNFLTWFIDGFSTEDGGAIVIGNAGTTQNFYMESGKVWVVKLDAKGFVTAEQTFSGRHGRVAGSPDGSCVIVYDKSHAGNQDVWLQALDPDLKLSWEYPLFSENWSLILWPHNIASMPGGGFIVVTTKFHRFWIMRLDERGRKVWEFLEENNIEKGGPIRSLLNKLIPSNNSFFVVSAVVKKSRSKVEVIKFTAK